MGGASEEEHLRAGSEVFSSYKNPRKIISRRTHLEPL